ncbi:DUF6975 family protein [Sphingomonas arantia]|uniref:DUF6975 family protein n=1 Tax=Sphingomonas arantia TaxID=1460676 RepID=A0ABW4TZZ0_9SPHN
MASQPTHQANPGSLAKDLITLVQQDGSASHGWAQALLTGAPRDLSDAAHQFAALHARHPGVIDLAGNVALLAPLADRIATAFAAERAYLAALVVAVGPVPGTPGQAQSEAALVAQRHALETLAQSDRTGCACGTVTALLLDWAAIRPVLDAAARHFGLTPPPSDLPDPTTLTTTIDAVEVPPLAGRAAQFGARQLLLQHNGLWDLLEARAHARGSA